MEKYRYDIGLSKYPYGIELEFMYASLRKINMKFERASIPSVLLLRHKNSSIVYDKCYLDRDNTVSYESNDIIYGGEISSRLYHNKKYD